MSDTTAYWTAGPETRAKIDARIARQIDASKRRQAFQKKHGIETLWGQSDTIMGATFPKGATPPPCWRLSRKHAGMWLPRLGKRDGKELDKEIRALGFDGSFGVDRCFGGLALHRPGFHIFGTGSDAVYVVKHLACAKVPADCKPLKASKYFAMLEAEEAKAAGSRKGRAK